MIQRDEDGPEFGPGGYLPDRAAARARKIVLRAPLGAQWIAAAVLAGVVVVVAGALLLTRGGAPGEPFVAVAPVERIAGQLVRDETTGAWMVGLGGRVRAFATDEQLSYCDASRRLEAPSGGVWSLTGRALGVRPSLPEHPAVTTDGVVYVDPTVRTDPGPAASHPVAPSCG